MSPPAYYVYVTHRGVKVPEGCFKRGETTSWKAPLKLERQKYHLRALLFRNRCSKLNRCFTQEFLRHVIKLRSEFFHGCIFAGNFTSLLTVQSYLCGDGASENSLMNTAKRPRHEASQPTDPGRGMSVADNDAGAKYGEAGKTDITHGVFLHAHDSRIAKPAASCASCRRKQAKLGDSGVTAATRKGADDAELKSLQFFFAPARRSRTDTHTAQG